jgi:hypothetical protein
LPSREPRRIDPSNPKIVALLFCLALIGFLAFSPSGAGRGTYAEEKASISDHFDGDLFFNPESLTPPPLPPGEQPRRGLSGWIWRWMFGSDWPEWPKIIQDTPQEPPAARVPKGSLIVTPVGHATFLIQLDGLNILTDPIWSERCSPVSWAGPKRYRKPGIRFEELPPIDAVLISHNHYDHLDLPTLKRLAGTGVQRAITTLGNRDLVRETGIPAVDELGGGFGHDRPCAALFVPHPMGPESYALGRVCDLRAVGKRFPRRGYGIRPPFPGDRAAVLADPRGAPSDCPLPASAFQ